MQIWTRAFVTFIYFSPKCQVTPHNAHRTGGEVDVSICGKCTQTLVQENMHQNRNQEFNKCEKESRKISETVSLYLCVRPWLSSD